MKVTELTMITLNGKPTMKTSNNKAWHKCYNPFVCLSDIIYDNVDMDYVVFNPFLKDKNRIKEIIFKNIKNYFGYELSDNELDYLASLHSYECNTFIDQIRKILNLE